MQYGTPVHYYYLEVQLVPSAVHRHLACSALKARRRATRSFLLPW